jgi:AcrR family transcriptional regulator
MEKTTATKSAKAKITDAAKLKKAYIDYVLEHGSKPASIFKFVKEAKIKEEAFYEEFNSFETIEKEIWAGWMSDTIAAIHAEEVYDGYSAREKLLAFYFTFVETLKSNRSFILQTAKKQTRPELTPAHLKSLRKVFKEFVNEILLEAKETEEVQNRPYISDKYDEAIWIQFLFVLNFWVKDDSKSFEKTDAAIEKAVNLSFDLMGRGPLDAMVDFAKFLFQNRS